MMVAGNGKIMWCVFHVFVIVRMKLELICIRVGFTTE